MSVQEGVTHPDKSDMRQLVALAVDVSAAGSFFAATEGGSETVYIPRRVSEAAGLSIGQRFFAWVIPNFPDRAPSVPWRALHASPSKAVSDSWKGATDRKTMFVETPASVLTHDERALVLEHMEELVFAEDAYPLRSSDVFRYIEERDLPTHNVDDRSREIYRLISNQLGAWFREGRLATCRIHRPNTSQVHSQFYAANVNALTPRRWREE